jgi:hypothetical protein
VSFVFETTCINADGNAISAMQAAAKPITYRTLLRKVGREFLALQEKLGYDVPWTRERVGLTMKRDWAVSYHRSTYCGKQCVYFVWSRIEHIFTETS